MRHRIVYSYSEENFTKDIKFSNLKTKEDFVLWLKILKKNSYLSINKNLVI